MCGRLLRASKVCQRPSRNTSIRGAEIHQAGHGRADITVAGVQVARGDVHAAAEGNRQMRVIAEHTGFFLAGVMRRPC
jgi:hypothetical protein